MPKNVGRLIVRHPIYESFLFVEEKKPSVRGMWTVPGGYANPGESHAAAAIRETGEETGYRAVLLGEQPLYETHVEEGDIDLRMYLGQISGGICIVQPAELLNARWLNTAQVQGLNDRGKLRDSFVAALLEDPRVMQPWVA